MFEPHLPLWALYVQVFGTLFAATVAAAIAGFIQYRQWKLSSDKIRLDLFDRRMSILRAIEFTIPDLQVGEASGVQDTLKCALDGLKGHQFLFDKETSDLTWNYYFKVQSMYFIAVTVCNENLSEQDQHYNSIMEDVKRIRDKLRERYEAKMTFVN